MIYTPALISPGSSITAGIYTLAIPSDSSSPTTGPLVLTASFDSTQKVDLYSLPLTLTATSDADPASLTWGDPFPTAQAVGGFTTAKTGTLVQTAYVQAKQTSTPGTYSIAFTVTDGTNTATATVQLTIAATSDATIPPSPTNGEFSVWAYPAALTVAPMSSVQGQAGMYPQPTGLLPLAFDFSGLPTGVLMAPGPIGSYGVFNFTLWTSDEVADGVYNITVTGSWTANPNAPSPANQNWAASFTFTLTVQTGYVAPQAQYKPPVKGRSYGVVGGNSISGYTLRRFSQPLQPRTSKQLQARQVFSAAKLGWKAFGPNGANYVLNKGVTPQEAWLAQNLTYNGILTAGHEVLGVQSQGTLGPCASGEAYMVMVQINRANLNLTPLPTPEITNTQIGLGSTPPNETIGAWTWVTYLNESAVNTPVLLNLQSNFSGGTNWPNDSSFSHGILPAGFGVTVTNIDQGYERTAQIIIGTAVANGSTIKFSGIVDTFGLAVSNVLTVTGATPDGWNVTQAPITAFDSGSITVSSSATPATLSNTPVGEAYNLNAQNAPLLQIAVTIDPTVPVGTYTFDLITTYQGTQYTQPIQISVVSGPVQAAYPCPTFIMPIGMKAKNTLGPSYDVEGFVLTPQWASDTEGQNQIPFGVVPYIFQVTASAAYTSSSGKPAVSDWKVILYTPGELMVPADVLAAWEDVFGALPDSGYIAFQVCTMDPATGTTGPAISKTASWTLGSTKGIDFTTSTCPYFQLGAGAYTITGKQGTTITQVTDNQGDYWPLTTFESWTNGDNGPASYSATMPYDAASAKYPALPSWITVTFGTPTQTAPPPWPQASNTWYIPFTIALSSAAPVGDTQIEITGETSEQTFRLKITVTVTAA